MVRPTTAKGKKPQREPEPEPEPEVLSDAAISHEQLGDGSEEESEPPVSPTPKPKTPRLSKTSKNDLRSFIFTYSILPEMGPEEQDGFIEFDRPHDLQEYLQDNPKRYERLFDIQGDIADKLKCCPQEAR
ncbi:uncharacterized protein N7443_009486 [Penicillium atrosanguineum]|uniref:Uncharacterized protein n=1 Tax=Penicillium atrosanguineum TaxID=1132637 RepID=A0A9W9U0P9_9EURO|nr:uncharacterized protein N7443_009486 [Penicillium atrosanguineum]KAJ5126446.1 hypothetical protein N7526_008623 [Penicillium atrosanguineum]KAJ5293533.1 hypothetical protein N7443_009486 [Penicillium atrosanguineum]KAJ5302429.1 hypothetical protein N7476_009228 [Penicillium atrosanguineum]